MAHFSRHVAVDWAGPLKEGGKGTAHAGSGAFTLPVTFPQRIGESEGATSPEELIAAAHASCYAMALNATVGRKGGAIKRITQRLNPRVCRVAALPAPNDRERTQWYFQRYVSHLPAAGEIVLFDRSWYNRAGVERVMGFCTDEQYEEFFRTVPEFEKMLVSSGIQLIKYWFSISDEEQHSRFLGRIHDPLKQWKLSPMDLESRRRWEEYTKAKEEMFARTNIPEAPWYIVEGNDKKRARLNCIAHFLSLMPYHSIPHDEIHLPERVFNPDYERAVLPPELYVPSKY